MRFALVMVLALSGCSTVNMESRSDSPYAPVNDQNGGRVSYLATGIPHVVSARREEAYKQMYERCGGPYRIVAENGEYRGSVETAQARTYGRTAYGSGTNVSVTRRVIDFECENRQSNAN